MIGANALIHFRYFIKFRASALSRGDVLDNLSILSVRYSCPYLMFYEKLADIFREFFVLPCLREVNLFILFMMKPIHKFLNYYYDYFQILDRILLVRKVFANM